MVEAPRRALEPGLEQRGVGEREELERAEPGPRKYGVDVVLRAASPVRASSSPSDSRAHEVGDVEIVDDQPTWSKLAEHDARS